MAISMQSGYPVSSNATGETTLALGSSQQIGDLVYLSIQTDGSSPGSGLGSSGLVSSITDSAGQISTWTPLCFYGDPTLNSFIQIYVGQVMTNPGVSTTLTISYAVANTTTTNLVAFCLTSDLGSSATWSLVNYAGNSNSASTTVTWPSVMSNAVSEQAYLGTSWLADDYNGSPSSGFTGYSTSNSNAAVYNLGLSPSTGYAPTCLQTGSAKSSTLGIILSASEIVSAYNSTQGFFFMV